MTFVRIHGRWTVSIRLFVLAVAFAVSIGAVAATWFYIAQVLTSGTPVTIRETPPPSSFVWGDKVFSTKAEVAAWLRSRGLSYQTWARVHPGAAKIIHERLKPEHASKAGIPAAKPKPVRASAAGTTSQESRPVNRPTGPVTPGSKTVAARPQSSSPSPSAPSAFSSPLALLLAMVALLLAALALAPESVWRRILPRMRVRFEQRIYPAGGAVAIVLGLVVGGAFS